MFTIHSVGDSAFLEQILIAIAMVTNTGDFVRMVSSGLLLGVLIMAFQSLFRGGQTIPFQQILVCWIIYACMFGPSTTVLIEDAYTGEVRVVSGVPVGVAGAGSMISTVGYSITRLFETGYGVISPSVTTTQFADSLKLLNDVRRNMADPAIFDAINTELGPSADMRRSLYNYVNECTLVKLDRGEISADQMFTSHTMSALRFTSEIYGTTIFDGSSPDGVNVNCSEGYDRIVDMLSVIAMDPVNLTASAVMRETDTASHFLSRVSDAMTALGLGMSDAQSYVKLALIEPVYHEAAAGKYNDFRDYTSSMMVNQAIQQRNVQWSAESSMFMSIVRPMLTFIEGFVYAITPFMAFLVVLGGFGIQLAVKYGQMLLWTQLWMPVLAIINLFLHMAASREMASYGMDTAGIMTFYNLSRASDIMENWIATGGMLAAATPILTLILVSGSSYAMTSLAGRMQGGDHLNEKMMSPDAATNDAVLKNMPMEVRDPTQGQRAFGAEQMIGSFDVGAQAQNAVSSAQTHMASSSQSFQQALQSAINSSAGTSAGSQLANGIAASIQSSGASGSTALESSSMSLARSLGFTGAEAQAKANQIQAQLAGGGGLSINTPKGLPAGVAANLGGSASSSSSETGTSTFTMTAEQAQSFLESNQISSSQMAEIRNSLAEDVSSRSVSEISSSWQASNSESLVQTASDLYQASQSYSELDSVSRSFGVNDSYQWSTLGNALASPSTDGQEQASQMLGEASQRFNSAQKAEVQERTNNLMQDGNYNEAQATQIARLEAMTNRELFANTGDYLDSMGDAMAIIGNTVGKTFSGATPMVDPGKNEELVSQTPSLDGSTTSVVSGGVQRPEATGHNGENYDSARQSSTQGISPQNYDRVVDAANQPPSAAIQNHNTGSLDQVHAVDRQNVSGAADAALAQSGPQLDSIANNITRSGESLSRNFMDTFMTGEAIKSSHADSQADLWIARMPMEDKQELVRQLNEGETSMPDILSSQSWGTGVRGANPEVAEAILRAETGDMNYLATSSPSVRNSASDLMSHRGGPAYSVLNDSNSYGEGFAPLVNEQIYQANFTKYAQQHPGLSEGVVGTMAAAYLPSGPERDALMEQNREIIAREISSSQPNLGNDGVAQFTSNIQKISEAHALTNSQTDTGMQHVLNYYDNMQRSESGERSIGNAGPAAYNSDSYPEHLQSSQQSQEQSSMPLPATNVRSNEDAPSSTNVQPEPLFVPSSSASSANTPAREPDQIRSDNTPLPLPLDMSSSTNGSENSAHGYPSLIASSSSPAASTSNEEPVSVASSNTPVNHGFTPSESTQGTADRAAESQSFMAHIATSTNSENSNSSSNQRDLTASTAPMNTASGLSDSTPAPGAAPYGDASMTAGSPAMAQEMAPTQQPMVAAATPMDSTPAPGAAPYGDASMTAGSPAMAQEMAPPQQPMVAAATPMDSTPAPGAAPYGDASMNASSPAMAQEVTQAQNMVANRAYTGEGQLANGQSEYGFNTGQFGDDPFAQASDTQTQAPKAMANLDGDLELKPRSRTSPTPPNNIA